MSSRLRIQVKVIPGAVREGIDWYGDMLKVKVRAPPEKGKANAAVLDLLARQLGIPETRLTLVSGQHSQLKTIEIAELADLQALRALLL